VLGFEEDVAELAARLGALELVGQLDEDDLVAELDADLAEAPRHLGEAHDELVAVAHGGAAVRRPAGLEDDDDEELDREAVDGRDGAGRLRVHDLDVVLEERQRS